MKRTSPALLPIPAPVRRRWREFRINILPVIGFGVMLVLVFFLWEDVVAPHAPLFEPPAIPEAPAQGAPGQDAGGANPPLAAGVTNALADPYSTKD